MAGRWCAPSERRPGRRWRPSVQRPCDMRPPPCRSVGAAARLVFLSLLSVPAARANPDARRLFDDLLSGYNRLIRPVSNSSDRVTVKLGLRLSQLMDLVRERNATCHCLSLIIIVCFFFFLQKVMSITCDG